MIKVLFVCLGNICRSPLAEGIFKQLVREEGLEDKIHIDSAGTSGWHIGEPPDPRTIEVAQKNGVPIEHYGKEVAPSDFEKFDYIIAMDDSNLADLERLHGRARHNKAQLFKMRDFDDIGTGGDVPDPYYGGPDGFDKVFDLLRRSSRNLLEKIKKDHNL